MKSVLRLAGASIISLSILAAFYFLSPRPPSRTDFIVRDGTWTSAITGKSFKVVAGTDIASQLEADEDCCQGYYEFEVGALPEEFSALQQPAMYLPAAACVKSMSINGKKISLDRPEYTSVGPVLPLQESKNEYPLKIIFETDCPRVVCTGLWKGPLLIGNFLDLVAFQSTERNFQKNTPLVSSAIFFFLGSSFFVIYFMTDRRFSFYLDVGFGLCSWAMFLFFLSGTVREWDSFWGGALHLPVRIFAAAGAFFVVRSYLIVINGQEEKNQKRPLQFLIPFFILALICLFYSMRGQNLHAVTVAGIGCVGAYVLVTQWPLSKLNFKSVGFVAFVVCLTTWGAIISDSIRMIAVNLKIQYPFPYFERYTANLFMATAVVLFFRHFIGLYQHLQSESLRAAKAAATGRAVRMIAHDVRAPFSSIRAALTILAKVKDDPSKVGAVIEKLESHVGQNVDRVNKMLKDIMVLGGELKLNREVVSAANLVLLVRELSGKREQQSVIQNIETDLPLLNVDTEKMVRALHNILENAFQASKADGIVALDVKKKIHAGREGVQFSIQNFGNTIAPEKRQKIFDEFYTEGKAGGTGLGLAITKEFVEAHEGYVACESDELSGTWFHVWIPW